MKRILCFGDSLTWGFNPDTRNRFGESERWPMVLKENLGDVSVIEEGQNGRTIASDDPAEGEKNGIKYIVPCLESHRPLDLFIVMLGTNDCKRKFSYCGMDVAGEMQIFLEKVISFRRFKCADSFKIILVSPPVISDSIEDSWLGDSFGYGNSKKISAELASWYKQLADMYNINFFDAASVAVVSNSDGIHMDAKNQQKLGKALADFIRENKLI